MSINEVTEKIKPFYTLLLVLAVASVFFAIGRIYSIDRTKTPIQVTYPNREVTGSAVIAVSTTTSVAVPAATTTITSTASTTTVNPGTIPEGDGPVIGSKSGKKYYFPWCGTVKRIKPENQVHFASIEDARKAGFLPGGNCKGLK